MTRLGGTVAVEVGATPDHMSYSQLAKLVGSFKYSCARQWGYRYLLQLSETSSTALVCGLALDSGLNRWWESSIGESEDVSAEHITAAFDAALLAASERIEAEVAQRTFDKPPTATDLDVLYGKVSEGLRACVTHERDRRAAAVQTRHEFTVGASTDDERVVTVTGWSDRIDTDGVIVDHKWTGSPHWNREGVWDEEWLGEKRDQLVVYWLARRAEAARGVPQPAPVVPHGRIVCVYHKLTMRTPQVHVAELAFGAEDERRVIETIRYGDAIAHAGRLPARPGEACRFCSFLGRCREDEEARGAPFRQLVGAKE